MAVQFNLLPDVKLEFNRSQHTKRMVYTLSALASLVVIGLFVISFVVVNVLQKELLNHANGDIQYYSNKIKGIKDLSQVLTIQNQLKALPTLHSQKHYTSRLFNYLPELTPNDIHIGKLSLDTTANTIQIDGTSDSVEHINKFVDTFKYAVYSIPDVKDKNTCSQDSGNWHDNDQTCTKLAFNQVVLTRVDRSQKEASYTLNASYDPALFTGTKGVDLVVNQEVTTRSVLDAPSLTALFNGDTGKPSDTDKANQGGQ
jgi:hypothetical protein